MTNDLPLTDPRIADETWQEIDAAIHRMAQLAKSALTAREFFAELLDRAVTVLAASGGAIWTSPSTGQWVLEYQINFPTSGMPAEGAAAQHHARLLQRALQTGRSQAVPPRSGPGGNGDLVNSTEYLLLICPLVVEGDEANAPQAVGVLEILQRPGASPAAQDGYLQFLETLAETAGEFHRNSRLRELQRQARAWERLQRFGERAHASLDLKQTTYTIANEGRQLIGCDRLSVAARNGNRWRLWAVSGLDEIHRRANSIRRLEGLIEASLASGESFWHSADSEEIPPHIEQPLRDYWEESPARILAIIPLAEFGNREPSGADTVQTVGALVIEHFQDDNRLDVLKERAAAICRHSGLALRNAREHCNLPLFPLLDRLRHFGWFSRLGRTRRSRLLLGGATLLLLALALIPADLNIQVRGQLQPQIRQNVFATGDGVVDQLFAEHGAKFAAGDVLITLRDSKLDYQFGEVLGEIQTTQTELRSVRSSLLSMNATDPATVRKYNDLTSRESLLQEKLKNLQKRHRLLEQQRAELSIRSPIDGEVLTWDVDPLLRSRPVRRGQTLLQVADLSGPWTVEMQVPDNRIGYVLQAQQELGPQLDVSFILITHPKVTHHGTVQEVAMATALNENQEATVQVTAGIDRRTITELRPGATVLCKIHCGRHPIGYVWFHDFVEAIRTYILF